MYRLFAVALLAILQSGSAGAQISLDELDTAIDQRTSTLSKFQQRLESPDPKRAMAAMQIMIEKGDADQRRMAIRHGLFSPDIAIRAEALRAIFNSAPAINIYLKPKDIKKINQYFARSISNFGGTLKPDWSASITAKIGEYDAENKCWKGSRGRCAVRLNADVVAFFIEAWGQLTLDQEGNLRGVMNVSATAVDVVIPLAE